MSRKKKIARSDKETAIGKAQLSADLYTKELLTVKETAQILNCSTKLVYRLIEEGRMYASNFLERKTRIRKTEIDRLVERTQVDPSQKKKVIKRMPLIRSECYTITEVQRKFNIQSMVLYRLMKEYHIRKEPYRQYFIVSKNDIDNLLKDYLPDDRKRKKRSDSTIDRRRFYTIGDAERVLKVSPSTALKWLEENGIAKTRHGKFNLVSKSEVDRLAVVKWGLEGGE